MDCFQEKEARIFFGFLTVCLLLGAVADWFVYGQERNVMAQFLAEQSARAASALLEAGISPVETGRILTEGAVTRDGTALAERIGTDMRMERLVSPFFGRQRMLGHFLVGKEILLTVLVAGGVLFYLERRETLYGKAVRVLEAFLRGDYAGRLPGTQEGTLYRLFSLTDHLARALEAGKLAEIKSREFLKQTISDISHQLKTPLAALSMYNEIIRQNAGGKETVKEFSERSVASLIRMEELIGMLLKLARLDAGSIRFEKRNHPALELAERAVEELWLRSEREGKELRIQQDMEELTCDLAWSAEALQNLVKNALDHTGRGGSIRITWEKTPLMFRISVADDGEGIPPEDLHHVFKRFYRGGERGHGSEKDGPYPDGIGLGLPLVRAIMEGQGGSVSARSMPGEGTVFTLSFLVI